MKFVTAPAHADTDDNDDAPKRKPASQTRSTDRRLYIMCCVFALALALASVSLYTSPNEFSAHPKSRMRANTHTCIENRVCADGCFDE